MNKHENDDKPIDWVVLIGGMIFIMLGIVGPYLLYVAGGLDVTTWGFNCWQPYVAVICAVVYFSIGKVILDIRRDEDET